MLCKKGVKNFAIFTGKQHVGFSFLIKLHTSGFFNKTSPVAALFPGEIKRKHWEAIG